MDCDIFSASPRYLKLSKPNQADEIFSVLRSLLLKFVPIHLYNIFFHKMKDMRKELDRLATFNHPNWPRDSPVIPSQLSRAGFYYQGNQDEVKCFSCHGRIMKWSPGDNAMDEHKSHFPDCPFIKNPAGCGNEPLGYSGTSIFASIKPGVRTQDQNSRTSMPNMSEASLDNASPLYTDNNSQSSNLQNAATALPLERTARDSSRIHNSNSLSSLNSLQNNLPKSEIKPAKSVPNREGEARDSIPIVSSQAQHSDMNVEAERLKTFSNWPYRDLVSPIDLAAAGFYYMGNGDEVKCFSCRGRVLSWDRGDKPLEEHKKHFPNCPFLVKPSESGNRPLGSKAPLTHEQLRYESKRLETLEKWPKKHIIDITKMAEVGLYFSGKDDKIVCAFCNGAMVNWAEGDEPAKEHYKYFADKCPIVKGESTDNVPLKKDTAKKNEKTTFQQLNIITERPRHPRYAARATRVTSFGNWPINDIQPKDKLADAGFFYAGIFINIYYHNFYINFVVSNLILIIFQC